MMAQSFGSFRLRRIGMGISGLILSLALLGGSTLAWAHDEDGRAKPAARVLGTIHFPTGAASAEAQEAFIRGMLLLHLFEYDFARAEFLQAQEIESGFAMAYWGEAMSYNHPVWDEQDQAAGRAALAKLGASPQERQVAASQPVEKAFLQAIDELYGSGTKAERDRAYTRAMEQMAAEFPADHEVRLFHALSLLGLQAGVRDIPLYMQATAIAQSVFSENPQHPGAAHYLIHGVDDPEHAVLGLEAARALAIMAPDAGHSLHMTSHIFTALGMWDDVVRANRQAIKVANAMRELQDEPARHWGHYNFWLLYGYLQQGRVDKARDLLTKANQQLQENGKSPEDPMILDPDRSELGSVVQMWARFLIETRQWDSEIASWKFNMGDAYDPNLNFSFVQAMRAVHDSSPSLVAQYLQQFRQIKDELSRLVRAQDEIAPTDLLYLDRLAVLEQEIVAGIEIARGEYQAAAGIASEASRLEGGMPYAFGPPFVDLPSAELWGESLLTARKYVDAAAAFEEQLKRTRLRSRSLLGLARAQHRAGHEAEASYSLEKLAEIWRRADPPVEAERDELAREVAQAISASTAEAVEAAPEVSQAAKQEE
ncbi:MAG TPA: hypothetical protein VI566_03785 [Xanthomonadales bacterium]|nr:hypothetical protein [Xanthomonadales bacterium]